MGAGFDEDTGNFILEKPSKFRKFNIVNVIYK